MPVSSKDYAAIWQEYQLIRALEPAKSARDIAFQLAISEAELAEARVGYDAVRLEGTVRHIFKALESVGEAKSICRNEYAVHEMTGRFTNQHISDRAGVVLNPRGLDLRLFMSQWACAYYLREQGPRGERRSIQFFDHQGDALLKIYATPYTDGGQWDEVVERFSVRRQVPLSIYAPESKFYDEAPDAEAVDHDWREMTDVHQFFNLLRKHNISRQQAFRLVGDDLACQVSNDALPALLQQVQQEGNEIMIFVGNRGCIQIFTGALEKCAPVGDWLRVMNKIFTLHLREAGIHESWVTRKPSADGHVTSLELFAEDGTQIAQLYGQRSEGDREQACWRGQIKALTPWRNEV